MHAPQMHCLSPVLSALLVAGPSRNLLHSLCQLAQAHPSPDPQVLLVPVGIELSQEHWHEPDPPPDLAAPSGMWASPAAG